MRFLLRLILLLAVLLGCLWYFGEGWAARQGTVAISEQPDLSAQNVTPLRELRRVGLRAEGVDFQGSSGALSLPWIELSIQPLALTTATMELPPEAALTMNGQEFSIGIQDGRASLHISPLHSMALSDADLSVTDVTLDGMPVAGTLAISAQLAGLGHQGPSNAGAAYDIQILAELIDPAALTPLGVAAPELPGLLSAEGGAKLWLDTAPGLETFGKGTAPQPQLLAVQTDGMVLQMGDISVRVVGLVSRDADGLTEGRLALYTADATKGLQLAVDMGMIPPAAATFGKVAIRAIAAISPNESPETPGDDDLTRRATTAQGQQAFPEPSAGELRLPIFFTDGQSYLGAIPIGPAPRFPAN